MSRATDSGHQPHTWGGVNRNTGQPFNNGKPAAGGRTDREGGNPVGGGSGGGGGMTKAGGQPSAHSGPEHMNPGWGDIDGQSSGGWDVSFPREIGTPKHPHYMTFRPWKITGGVGGTTGDMTFKAAMSAGVSQVSLPIPTMNTTYAQGWDKADVNATQGGMLRGIKQAFGGQGKATEGGPPGSTEVRIYEQGKAGVTGAMEAYQGGGSISEITSKIANAGIAGNAAAGITLGMAGKVLGEAASTALGVASFNQTMAFYQGPAFREFSFAYQMHPQDSGDQFKILQIVDFFKQGSAPDQISSGLFRIYEIPFAFTINFYGVNGEMTHINKIARCACTNVAVTYGGDRFNTFQGTDAPVQTNLSLSFKEIELVTKAEMQAGY